MSDPTFTVLAATFFLALLVFAIPALLRGRIGPGAQVPGLPPMEPGIPEWPAQRDEQVPGEDPRESARDTDWLPAVPPPLPASAVPLWPYRTFDILGIACVFVFFSMLVLLSAGSARDSEMKLDVATLLVNIAFQFILAGMVVGAMAWRIRPGDWLGLRWRKWPWVLLLAPASVLVMLVVFQGLHLSGYVRWMESLGSDAVQETVRLLQESKDPVVLGLMAFTAVLVAPLCEEVVFRGYFYPVAKKFAGAWPAAVCSALVFSAAHANLTALLPLFLFGLLLVFLYEKTGSIWAPVAVHLCFNGTTVAVQLAARVFDIPIQTSGG